MSSGWLLSFRSPPAAKMSTDPNNPVAKFVVIIGAGISGIVQAVEVHRKNVLNDPANEMAIFEKAGGFGGVWYANTYPGAPCDIVSHIYSISWFPKHGMSLFFFPADIRCSLPPERLR